MRTRLIALIPGLLAALLAVGVLAAELRAQRSSSGGVTVEVTPQNFAASARSWDFQVVLDTHSAELNDDLVKSASLVTGGKALAPSAWDGDPPGGHHRKGILKFNAVEPRPLEVELRIVRPGEAQARSFRWQLK